MGTYTQIASLYRPRPGSGRGKDIARERAEQITESPWVCPECDDGAAFEAVCERCKVTTVPTEGLVRVAPARQANPIRRSPGVLLFAAACVLVIPLSLGAGQLSAVGRAELAQFAIGAALFVLAAFALASLAIRARRSRIAGAVHTPAELPERAERPVSVDARLVGMEGGSLVLEGADGRFRVRAPEQARAYDGADRTGVLHLGDEVEVVGVGGRARGAGQGYRDERGEFVFEGPVQMARLQRRRTEG